MKYAVTAFALVATLLIAQPGLLPAPWSPLPAQDAAFAARHAGEDKDALLRELGVSERR